jgi:hypothetical protein
MSESSKPVPPYRVHLQGSDADLKDLASCLKSGRTRVFQQDGVYFLESEILDEIRDPAALPNGVRELLQTISSVARVRRSIAKPIGVANIRWKDLNGTWYRMLTASETIINYSNTISLTASGIFERCVQLALENDLVRGNLDDFLGEWDFPRLRRVGETMLLDLGQGDIRKGLQEVVNRGWTPRTDCERFWDTVNHGDPRSLGAHSKLRRGPGNNPMNVIQAGEFLRDLIAKWLESKM